MNRTIQDMRANLNKLERTRDRSAPVRDPRRIREIKARIRASGCDSRQQVTRQRSLAVPPASKRRDKVIVREGTRRVKPREKVSNAAGVRSKIIAPPPADSFRTMCVRLCDGYYFPMSFSTGPEYFERDKQACSAMCPAAETKLYYHRVPGEESEAMISLEGEAYTALPNAFLYRKRAQDKTDSSCTCGTPVTLANLPTEEKAPLELSAIPTPAERPDAFADPESQMDLQTGLSKGAVRELTGAVTHGKVRSSSEGNREVRVVGPQFLPDPEGAIDLRSPDRRNGR
ncbi:DUF2865 domain-containing protein [Oricola cellulosilytica]|uniref:DUF2865 domain-containing protein n=3 Tax=Oricola cellulosilytica TaxID=1429082 RepID=A0A4R0P4G8_9HYPH|nr:DUF2865 domain-containing protein [Oricola cellulosilytica]